MLCIAGRQSTGDRSGDLLTRSDGWALITQHLKKSIS